MELDDYKNLCGTCQTGGKILNKINGIVFTEPKNISEDIFFSSALGQATVIVSEKFKKIVEKNRFTNIDLLEVLKYKWDSLNPPDIKDL